MHESGLRGNECHECPLSWICSISQMEALAKDWYRSYRVVVMFPNQSHRWQSDTLAHCSPAAIASVPDDNEMQSIGRRVPSLEEYETSPPRSLQPPCVCPDPFNHANCPQSARGCHRWSGIYCFPGPLWETARSTSGGCPYPSIQNIPYHASEGWVRCDGFQEG